MTDQGRKGQGDLMQVKNTYIAFSLLPTCCLALSLASCQSSSWYLAAAKKGGTVELYLSNGDECPQVGGVSPGFGLSSLLSSNTGKIQGAGAQK